MNMDKLQIQEKTKKLLEKAEEPYVKKAVSWILREITKMNPDEVTKFLIKWAKASPGKDMKWIIKDGLKKLSDNEQKKILGLLD